MHRIAQTEGDILMTTPSMARSLFSLDPKSLSSLRLLLLGGEPVPHAKELSKWRLSKKLKIMSLYGNYHDSTNILGSTEQSIWSMICHNPQFSQNSALGKPLSGVSFAVISEQSKS